MRPRGAGESALLLLDVVDVLKAARIKYAVVGAVAASVHGAVRASLDADVLIAASQQQVTGLDDSFRKAGFHSVVSRGEPEDQIPASTLEFVGREDFIAMKVSAGGPLNLLDAERAVAADPASLDVQLVRGLAARVGKHASAALNSILSAELGAGDDATEGS